MPASEAASLQGTELLSPTASARVLLTGRNYAWSLKSSMRSFLVLFRTLHLHGKLCSPWGSPEDTQTVTLGILLPSLTLLPKQKEGQAETPALLVTSSSAHPESGTFRPPEIKALELFLQSVQFHPESTRTFSLHKPSPAPRPSSRTGVTGQRSCSNGAATPGLSAQREERFNSDAPVGTSHQGSGTPWDVETLFWARKQGGKGKEMS